MIKLKGGMPLEADVAGDGCQRVDGMKGNITVEGSLATHTSVGSGRSCVSVGNSQPSDYICRYASYLRRPVRWVLGN